MGWLDDWEKRIELTIDNTNVDSDLADFPVLVYISAASGIGDVDASAVFDELSSDANRKKIAVTTSDGTTQCYVEIERWDHANEVAWLWVKVPSVTAASSTTIYLYYDSAKADNTGYVGDTGDTPAQSVWDSNFIGVWHMAQDPNGDPASAIKDSTSNENHGTPAGSMTTADLVDGKIGKGIEFDGSDDYLNIPDTDAFTFSNDTNDNYPFTISAIIKPTNLSSSFPILAKNSITGPTREYWFYINSDGSLRHYFKQMSNSEEVRRYSDSSIITPGVLQYVAATYDGTESDPDDGIKLFVNGDEKSASGITEGSFSAMENQAVPLLIGKITTGTSESPIHTYAYGIIDEVRLSDIKRSTAWIKAEYYSNWDSLITWGSEASLFIEDASLDLSAYSCTLENLQAFLRAHDGIELRDLQAAIEAFHLSTKDFSTLLIAALESTGDFAADFETWATQYKDLAGDFDAKGQSIESLTARFETAKAKYKNLAAFLSVTDGSVLKDLTAFLSVTDGSVLKNLGLSLKTIQSMPAFRSIIAQRVSSVVHEVS